MGAVLELHDARIKRVRIESDGIIGIDFAHICGRFPTVSAGPETWSCTATICISGSSRFTVEGTLAPRDYVSHGSIFDTLGRAFELPASTEAHCGPGTIDILLAGSGSRISGSYASLALERIERIRLLDRAR
jgi:hypothetical protein